MAEKRMFAKTIIDSDAFVEMPISARLLYYDLGMRADDDGFVNSPKKIMRMIGASEDDMRILAMRKFIIPFDNGLVVIKHWRINNYLRSDRYRETTYKDEKALLLIDENNAYTLADEEEKNPGIPLGIPMVDADKNRLDKNRLDKSTAHSDKPNDDGFNTFWAAYPRKVGKKTAQAAWAKIKNPDIDLILDAISKQKKTIQWTKEKGSFIPHPTTWLNQERWNDEVDIEVKKLSAEGREVHDYKIPY